MNLFTPPEVAANISINGQLKIGYRLPKAAALAVLAGAIVALSGAASSTATHALGNVSAGRIAGGLLFPFALGIIVAMGGELFTGSCLNVAAVLCGRARLGAMLANWLAVYSFNFMGAALVAAACAFCGQFNYSNGALAVYTIQLAAAKCSLPFAGAFVLGVLCNVCVCLGVAVSAASKDISGRIIGAYIPVALFVISGFEHSIANMYYIPAGLFALNVPEYAALCPGLDVSALTWSNFFANNLLPVTLGNIAGGLLVGVMLWFCHLREEKPKTAPAGQ